MSDFVLDSQSMTIRTRLSISRSLSRRKTCLVAFLRPEYLEYLFSLLFRRFSHDGGCDEGARRGQNSRRQCLPLPPNAATIQYTELGKQC